MRIGFDQPALVEVEAGDPLDHEEYGGPDEVFGTADFDDRESLRPINWNLLTADEALIEWTDLDAWIDWVRLTYGLPPTVVPPYWHRHDELIWELDRWADFRLFVHEDVATRRAIEEQVRFSS